MTRRASIDFQALGAALLERAHVLVPQWLPAGVERAGRWYCGDFDGADGESANVDLRTGTWIDNAGGDEDRGGDLVSLYGRIKGLGNAAAARELMAMLGWQHDGDSRPAPAKRSRRPAAASSTDDVDETPPDVEREPAAPRRRSVWRAITPVPPHAPPTAFRFAFRDKKRRVDVELEAACTWAYRRDGQLLGHVARFERVDSRGQTVKDTLPRTWCVDESDDRGTQRWAWKQWEAPRPLYLPAGTLPPDVTVVIVEGEKCADAGHGLGLDGHAWVSWPGGCKAWAHADWSWLAGRRVLLWADCDAQRERLTKAEKDAGVDPATKPLQPEERQPGVQAMTRIGELLQATHGCDVRVVRIPAPGTVPDGWDVADAIADGWDAERVQVALRDSAAFVAPTDAARAAAAPVDVSAGADGADADAWRAKLLTTGRGAIAAVRENIVLALDGVDLGDGRRLAGIADVAGLIRFNDFSNNVEKVRPTPWGTPAGVWDEGEELELGDWLVRQHWLPPMSRQALEEAVVVVARRHRIHPAREAMAGLRGRWDGTERLRHWMGRCLRADGEVDADPALAGYLARVGTWLCMAIVARVLQPGCKFDYMAILEGPQGLGKSTLCRLLARGWFADTGLTLGDKDTYQNLQGVLVYEWGELDALTRAEVTKVKQFVSSQTDRFRASFDRRPRDYPRQVVFIGTTNEFHYLSDPTGNRRFWPVRVTRPIDHEWLRDHLEQLFAEAIHRLDAGERYHPRPAEEVSLFEPQQTERTVENAMDSAIRRLLYDEDQRVGIDQMNWSHVDELSLNDLLTRLGISVDKQTLPLMKQASAALGRLGWERGRAKAGRGEEKKRPWVYRRPNENATASASAPPCGSGTLAQRPTPGTEPVGAADACPF